VNQLALEGWPRVKVPIIKPKPRPLHEEAGNVDELVSRSIDESTAAL
jgi:hypothetical protein